ncbi:hypothetical protein BH10CYA1_BH10CYA1_50100 [soil metagenome]
MLAFVLFGLTQCIFASRLQSFDLETVNYAKRFDFESTVHGIENLTTNPKVIFLGTSLLRYPFYDLNEKLQQSRTKVSSGISPIEDAHRCLAAPGSLSDNYSFAIAGILVSDFNLIFRKFISRDITDDTVYVECSPRAFYDSNLQPSATPAFKYFCDLQEVLSPSKSFSDRFDRLQWLTNILLPTYRFRHDIQENVAHLLAVRLSGQSDVQSVEHVPFRHATAAEALARSIAEYQGRYAGISIKACKPQLSQLQDLIGHVQAKKAKPVLLVMPLTQVNIELLPGGFYDDWKNSIKQIAARHHCKILDLSEYQFENSDFRDSVHLSSGGAAKFLNVIESHRH